MKGAYRSPPRRASRMVVAGERGESGWVVLLVQKLSFTRSGAAQCVLVRQCECT